LLRLSQSSHRWLPVAIAGCALIALALLTVALVTFDKEHFGGLVGSGFLQTLASGLLIGALLVLIGAWKVRHEGTWRWKVLVAWALLALLTPAAGWMFIIPLGVLALSLPVAIAALVGISRRLHGSQSV
jgi:hypothetical protein